MQNTEDYTTQNWIEGNTKIRRLGEGKQREGEWSKDGKDRDERN